jgi:hypothetical protein
VTARETRLASIESTSITTESAVKKREEVSRAAASMAAKAASEQADREREWAKRVSDEKAELVRLRTEAERLKTVAAAAETAATSAKERFELEARQLESDRIAVREAREALDRELLRAAQTRTAQPVSVRVNDDTKFSTLSKGFVDKDVANDTRRQREREELEALRADADAKLRLARETLESARKERESSRKEFVAASAKRGEEVQAAAASRDMMPPPPPRSAMPTPRRIHLDSEPSTPRDPIDLAPIDDRHGLETFQLADFSGDGTIGDAAIEALVDNLALRTAEAERKLQRAENLAAGSQIGGSKVNISSGIAALKSRLARIAVNSRRASVVSSDENGGGNAKKETIAALEQQERELAAWFADLQTQLEALFAKPKSARRASTRASWN